MKRFKSALVSSIHLASVVIMLVKPGGIRRTCLIFAGFGCRTMIAFADCSLPLSLQTGYVLLLLPTRTNRHTYKVINWIAVGSLLNTSNVHHHHLFRCLLLYCCSAVFLILFSKDFACNSASVVNTFSSLHTVPITVVTDRTRPHCVWWVRPSDCSRAHKEIKIAFIFNSIVASPHRICPVLGFVSTECVMVRRSSLPVLEFFNYPI